MPTPRQQKAAQQLVENLGKDKPEPLGAVLRVSGYSEVQSSNPQQVTRSKGFQEALQPLLKKHKLSVDRALFNYDLALNADKQNQFTGEITPDFQVRLKASDKVLELHGLKKAKENNTIQESVEELKDAIANNVDEVELSKVVFKKKE